VFDRILTPVIAIGLAFLVWMYTRSRDEEILDVRIPVEIAVATSQANDYELEIDGGTINVPVSFMGSPSRIRELRSLLQHGEVVLRRSVTVPEEHQADAKYPDVVKLDTAGLNLPPGVRGVIAENEGRVRITMRKLIEKQMQVRLRHDGGRSLEKIICEPATVMVKGPKEVLDKDDYVDTMPYLVPQSAPATEAVVVDVPQRVAIAAEIDKRPVRVTPGEVAVRYTLLPSQRSYEREVPVHFLCPLGFSFRPQFANERAGRVTIRVRGPATEQPPNITAYVDLTSRRFGAGLHAEEPIQVTLPPGFSLAQEPPRLSSFKLVPIDATRD
jgi:hypothetical protein